MSEILDLNHSNAGEAERRSAFRQLVPDVGVWEFINGEVRRQPPCRLRELRAEMNLRSLLHSYASATRAGLSGGGKMLVTTPRNDYMPDVWFLFRERAELLTEDTKTIPTPEFVAEIISPETEETDRGTKFDDYAINDVREYWLVDPVNERIERKLPIHVSRLAPVAQRDAVITAIALAGFSVPVRAIFDQEACLRATRRSFGSSDL